MAEPEKELELVYPYVEINIANGDAEVSVVKSETSRQLITKTEDQHITKSLDKAQQMLDKLDEEVLLEADHTGIEFTRGTDLNTISFDDLLEELTEKLNQRDIFGIEHTTPGDGVHEALVAAWHADLFLALKHAMYLEMVKVAIASGHKFDDIENYVLVPGEIEDTFVNWFAHDINELGYELQIKFD